AGKTQAPGPRAPQDRRRFPGNRAALQRLSLQSDPRRERLPQSADRDDSHRSDQRRRRAAVAAPAPEPGPLPRQRRACQEDRRKMTAFSGANVLITGGVGFIGSNLARRLVELGARVTLVDSLIPEYGGNLFNIEDIRERVAVNITDVRD